MSSESKLRTPRFLEPRESKALLWLQNLAVLCTVQRAPRGGRPFPIRDPYRRSRSAFVPLFVSGILHAALIFVAARYRFSPTRELPQDQMASDPAPIYLDLADLKLITSPPTVSTPAANSHAGKPAAHQSLPEAMPSPTPPPKLTIVITPLKPDDTRQTIFQKSSPPDLRITDEQHLPDVAVFASSTPEKPRLDTHLNAPTLRTNASATAVVSAPEVNPATTALPITVLAAVEQPRLPVILITPMSGHVPTGTSATSGLGANAESAGGPNDVLIASVSPETAAQLMHLPPGTRIGILAGNAGSEPQAPLAVTAKGSDGSAAASAAPGGSTIGSGRRKSGGGVGDAGAERSLSISGSASAPAESGGGRLPESAVLNSVFPVAVLPRLRRNPLIISTGPVGGGGLNVYGALHCGKVYTIFLPMPNKDWVLQYCALGGQAAPLQAQNGVVHLEAGLAPPDVEQSYDFHRFPVAEQDANKIVVLRATIGEDGAVSGVRVYQGVQANDDDAAALAFSRWKFKPALRAKSPVALDVLVGIPARVPTTDPQP